MGYLPASGTFASLVAIPLYLALRRLGPESPAGSGMYILVLLAFATAGIWISGRAEKIFREKDSHKIVIDEIVGFLFAMLWVPASFLSVAGAFLLFRFFDIAKPFPIGRSQKLPGGLGVVIDDVLAGIFAMVVIQLILVVF